MPHRIVRRARLVRWLTATLAVSASAVVAPVLAAASSPPAPQRIVALAPNVVELLFELGLGDRVVGIGDFCNWPPEVAGIPRLGGLVDPHFEAIVGLRPDLLVVLESEGTLTQQAERLGIEVLRLRIETAEDVVAAAESIAVATGIEARGREFGADFRRHLEGRRLDGSPSVLIVFGRPAGSLGQMMTTGDQTYITELLRKLGARNAFSDAIGRYPRIGLEEVLRRDPDWIVELQWEALEPSAERALLDDWRPYTTLQAVKNRRLGVVAGGHTVIPGPRLRRLFDELANLLGAPQPVETTANPPAATPMPDR